MFATASASGATSRRTSPTCATTATSAGSCSTPATSPSGSRSRTQLTRQAFHDGLTGLANRALLRDRLDQALARSADRPTSSPSCCVDLDGFKQVNDSLGHDAGDELLRAVAERFATARRPSDTLARLGGDEFALLLEAPTRRSAGRPPARLHEASTEPVVWPVASLIVGASVGIVVQPGGRVSATT